MDQERTADELICSLISRVFNPLNTNNDTSAHFWFFPYVSGVSDATKGVDGSTMKPFCVLAPFLVRDRGSISGRPGVGAYEFTVGAPFRPLGSA